MSDSMDPGALEVQMSKFNNIDEYLQAGEALKKTSVGLMMHMVRDLFLLRRPPPDFTIATNYGHGSGQAPLESGRS